MVAAALLVGALAGGAAGFGGAALLNNSSPRNVATPKSNHPSPSSSEQSSGTQAAADTTESAAAQVLPSVVKVYASSTTQSGSGSGIILSADGEILTNNHVAELAANGGRLAVSFNDGRKRKAHIVGRDPVTDLAVIKAENISGLQPATLGNSDKLEVGQQVVAVGAPLGLKSTVTTGIVSALDRPVNTQGENINDPETIFPAIQTDAAINPGNSGGPLVNLEGEVVGINSAIRTTGSSQVLGGQGGSIGLGFAIPINEAMPIVKQLRHHQKATHARIGITVRDSAGKMGLPNGATVVSVDPDAAGGEAGLEKGDLITKLNKENIASADDLVAQVRSYRPGQTVTLTVQTEPGSVDTIKVTLGSDA